MPLFSDLIAAGIRYINMGLGISDLFIYLYPGWVLRTEERTPFVASHANDSRLL